MAKSSNSWVIPVIILVCVGVGAIFIIGLAALAWIGMRTDDAAVSKVEQDGPFLYAPVRERTESAPERFAADLPTVNDWNAFVQETVDTYPPGSYVRDTLCAGDADMQARYLKALRQSADDGADAPKLVDTFGRFMSYCRSDAWCTFAREHVAGEDTEPVRAAFWDGLTDCHDDATAKLMTREDVPDAVLVEWWSNRRWGPNGEQATPYSARLVHAVERRVRDAKAWDARQGAFLLANMKDARARRALIALYESTPDEDKRRHLAAAMRGFPEPKARRIFEAACKKYQDANCPRDGASATAAYEIDWSRSSAELARNPNVSLEELVKRRRKKRDGLVNGLSTCAADSELSTYRRKGCFTQLLAVDRAAALAQLDEIDLADTPHGRELVTALRKYPESGALEARLAELQLIESAGANSHPGSARTLLEALGSAYSFDAETGMFPNEHDSLMRDLAALGGSPLAAAIFSETPPTDYDTGEPYVLHAWYGGKHYWAEAEDLGDWYDVTAVIGFLNAIARDVGSDTRFVSLATTDQIATVAAGPEASLRTAQSEGLLVWGNADEARAVGKAFEDEVFRALESGELELDP